MRIKIILIVYILIGLVACKINTLSSAKVQNNILEQTAISEIVCYKKDRRIDVKGEVLKENFDLAFTISHELYANIYTKGKKTPEFTLANLNIEYVNNENVIIHVIQGYFSTYNIEIKREGYRIFGNATSYHAGYETNNYDCVASSGSIFDTKSLSNINQFRVATIIENEKLEDNSKIGDEDDSAKSGVISKDQILQLINQMEPGDLLFKRKDNYLSNWFIGNYYTHVMLYLGTLDEAIKYFNTPEVNSYFRKILKQEYKNGSFSDYNIKPGTEFITYLQEYFSNVLLDWQANQDMNDIFKFNRIIESTSAGRVRISYIGYSALPDSLLALRPNLSKLDKALAIIDAFKYNRYRYDYTFSIESPVSIYCSKLIALAYAPGVNKNGILFDVKDIGFFKKGISPNQIVEKYSIAKMKELANKTSNTEPVPFSFVAFLKKDPIKNIATFVEESLALESYKYPGGYSSTHMLK